MLAYYVGIFLITMSGLMFEIGLTRIFSATIWYGPSGVIRSSSRLPSSRSPAIRPPVAPGMLRLDRGLRFLFVVLLEVAVRHHALLLVDGAGGRHHWQRAPVGGGGGWGVLVGGGPDPQQLVQAGLLTRLHDETCCS